MSMTLFPAPSFFQQNLCACKQAKLYVDIYINFINQHTLKYSKYDIVRLRLIPQANGNQ